MSYWYQYKQQCFIPGGVKHNMPTFTQCRSPGVVKSVPCASCASRDAKQCTTRRMVQSSPKCPTKCTSSCMEKHVVEGHSSSCSHQSTDGCTMMFSQPHGQHLYMPHFRQVGVMERPQVSAPVHVGQHSSYPCSYQWSDSYHYRCGQS
ncbi:uncharacterized protein LOC116654411 [Coturnix japonica]|uniref:Uncharacterized protein n=1 Tax=Coturnix japonica TaxID=93934 RepID=A0A8C2TQH4_COTJA|nr:uncharacterized protein LOC116654411 [Coturnix japonica]